MAEHINTPDPDIEALLRIDELAANVPAVKFDLTPFRLFVREITAEFASVEPDIQKHEVDRMLEVLNDCVRQERKDRENYMILVQAGNQLNQRYHLEQTPVPGELGRIPGVGLLGLATVTAQSASVAEL